jgi:Spy/CpxP family protein refolding chaperone
MNRLVLVCAFVAVLAAPGASFAQRPFEPPPDRETWAQRRTDVLATRLGLSDGQRTAAQALFTAADRDCEPVDEQLGKARRALRKATRSNASDTEIETLATSVGTLTAQIETIQAKADRAFYGLLGATQREKLEQQPLPMRRGGRR